MKPSKKTLVGGLTAIFLSFSCCWLSALALWIGGSTLLGVLAVYMESLRLPLIIFGIILITAAATTYSRKNEEKIEA